MVNKVTQAEIARVSEDAWRDAATLAKSVANSPAPVLLEDLAKSVGIRQIRFAPLISEAGLAKNGDDLEIVVNTEVSTISYSEGTTLLAHAGEWANLSPALRFTIAHEIAHAVFLKAAQLDYKADLFRKNERAVENGCNILARILLMPMQMLMRDIGDQLFDTEYMAKLCDSYCVSPEVFIRRFNVSDMSRSYPNADGFLAFARDSQDPITIKVCHIFGTLSRDRFHRALDGNQVGGKLPSKFRSLSDNYSQPRWRLEGYALNDLQLASDLDSKIRNAEGGQVPLNVGWGARR